MSKTAELVEEIEHQIRVGDLLPGDCLPAVRELTGSRNVAPNTVAAVYRALAVCCLVQGAGRKGTFVADTPLICRPISDNVPSGVLDLATGNPDVRLLPDLTGPLSTIGSRSVMYEAPQVLPELSEWFNEWFRRDGISVEGSGLVGGSLDGIERILTAQTRPGDKVGIEDPGYASIFDLVRALGSHPVPIAIDQCGLEPSGLRDAMSQGSDVLVVTPRGQNPTGAALDEERAGALSSIVAMQPICISY